MNRLFEDVIFLYSFFYLDVTTSKSQSPNNVPPPPPPPPPLPSADPVEKSVLLTSAAPSESVVRNSAPDPRSALMEAIRGGHTLKVFMKIFYQEFENICGRPQELGYICRLGVRPRGLMTKLVS